MLILGLDFETTGFDFQKDRITEVGAVLWDTATSTPVRLLSTLVKHADAPPISPEITRLTGIDQALLDVHGKPPREAFAELLTMASVAPAVAAHNGSKLDQPMFESELRRQAVTVPALLWIDTCLDVPFPKHIATRKLSYLAAEHGFLNPFSHRAVFDVLTMLRVMARYPLEEIMHSARQPIATCVAEGQGENADAPRKRGYRWLHGRWLKFLREQQAQQEVAEAGFPVTLEPFNAEKA